MSHSKNLKQVYNESFILAHFFSELGLQFCDLSKTENNFLSSKPVDREQSMLGSIHAFETISHKRYNR